MSLNEIRMPPQLIADLYSNVLIDSNTSGVPGKPEIQFLGNNEKNILVIVDNTNDLFLADEDLGFLSSILTACKLSLADIAIINWDKMEIKNYESLVTEIQINDVLLFDIEPIKFGLPINFPHYQIQKFDQRKYLYAPTLQELRKNITEKKQLWTALQKMFELN